MKRKLLSWTFGMLLTATMFTACKKDHDDHEHNHEELITTIKLTFVPVGGGSTFTYQFKDADGPGGSAPVLDQIVLAPSKSYNVSIQLLNEAHNPVEDVTPEVIEEAQAHRFYYQPNAGSNITVANLDNDTNGVPLGVTSTWTTGATATGNIAITLRHYGGNPPGKATSDLVDSPKSSTDFAVTFSTAVQ